MKEFAEEALESGRADLVSFGRPFIANPDLVQRLRGGVPLANAPKETYYRGHEKGHSDWPDFDVEESGARKG